MSEDEIVYYINAILAALAAAGIPVPPFGTPDVPTEPTVPPDLPPVDTPPSA